MAALRESSHVVLSLGVVASAIVAWIIWISGAIIDIKERVAKIEGKMEQRHAVVSAPADSLAAR
jgi:hypothetical protein